MSTIKVNDLDFTIDDKENYSKADIEKMLTDFNKASKGKEALDNKAAADAKESELKALTEKVSSMSKMQEELTKLKAFEAAVKPLFTETTIAEQVAQTTNNTVVDPKIADKVAYRKCLLAKAFEKDKKTTNQPDKK